MFVYDLYSHFDQGLRDIIQDACQHAEQKQEETQAENERRYNTKHCFPNKYQVDSYILYQGPCRITKVLDFDRYVVDIPGAQHNQCFYSGTLPSDRLTPYEPGAEDTATSETSATEHVRDVRLAETMV